MRVREEVPERVPVIDWVTVVVLESVGTERGSHCLSQSA